jgi:hypothetical protein
MNKKMIYFCVSVVYAISVITVSIVLADNPKLDVVSNYAVDSFENLGVVIEIINHEGAYQAISPNRNEIIIFGERVDLKFYSSPFLSAGFAPDKFEGDIIQQGDYFIIPSSGTEIALESGYSIFDIFENLLRSNRDSLEYHMDHDVFEFHLGGGHSFRWAKEWQTNTSGMVFVLNPEPFINAGLSPQALEGWALVNVTLQHGRGQTVSRLLKNHPFTLSDNMN